MSRFAFCATTLTAQFWCSTVSWSNFTGPVLAFFNELIPTKDRGHAVAPAGRQQEPYRRSAKDLSNGTWQIITQDSRASGSRIAPTTNPSPVVADWHYTSHCSLGSNRRPNSPLRQNAADPTTVATAAPQTSDCVWRNVSTVAWDPSLV